MTPRRALTIVLLLGLAGCAHTGQAPERAERGPSKVGAGVGLMVLGSGAAVLGGAEFASALGTGIGQSVSVAFGAEPPREPAPSTTVPVAILLGGCVAFVAGEVLAIWGLAEDDG